MKRFQRSLRAPARRRLRIPVLLLALVAALPAVAAAGQGASGASLGLRVGTTGYGPELAFPIHHRLTARLAAGFGDFDVDFDSEVVTYEGQVELQNVLAVVDLHPTGGSFRLSAGAMLHDNRLTGEAPIRDVLRDNGIDIPPALAPLVTGSLRAEAETDSVAPYVGLGFGHRGEAASGVRLNLDVGVAYHGEPDVSLRTAELPLLLDAVPGARQILDAVLAQEEEDLEAELEDYRYFPVVALTLAYRF